MDLIFSLHLASTLVATGLIWFVQVVHYPMFATFEEAHFSKHARTHANLTGRVVIPIMLTELFTGIALFSTNPASPTLLVNLILLSLVWISTCAIQVPLHSKLQAKRDLDVIRFLVSSNWIRTILWTARALLLIALGTTI